MDDSCYNCLVGFNIKPHHGHNNWNFGCGALFTLGVGSVEGVYERRIWIYEK